MSEPVSQILEIIAGTGGSLVMVIAGLLAIIIGSFGPAIAALYGIKAYGIKWWWSLIAFFVPFGSFVFIGVHWKFLAVRRVAFAIFGCLGVAIAAFVVRSFIATFFDLPLHREID
jgi:hypothetical protein